MSAVATKFLDLYFKSLTTLKVTGVVGGVMYSGFECTTNHTLLDRLGLGISMGSIGYLVGVTAPFLIPGYALQYGCQQLYHARQRKLSK
jgi:hypothetical protein